MEIVTSAPANQLAKLTVELTPMETVQLLADMRPELHTTETYDRLHAALENFARRHA